MSTSVHVFIPSLASSGSQPRVRLPTRTMALLSFSLRKLALEFVGARLSFLDCLQGFDCTHTGLDVLSIQPRGLTPKLRGTRGTRLALLLPSISHSIYSLATDWAPLRPRCDAASRSAIITARSIHAKMLTTRVHHLTCLDSSNYLVSQLFVLMICVQVGTSHGWCCRKSAVATGSESIPIISRVHLHQTPTPTDSTSLHQTFLYILIRNSSIYCFISFYFV